jgi:hypothetical protein
MEARILLSVAVVMLGWTVPSLAAIRAGVTTYLVQLVLYPGDDEAAVDQQNGCVLPFRIEASLVNGLITKVEPRP